MPRLLDQTNLPFLGWVPPFISPWSKKKTFNNEHFTFYCCHSYCGCSHQKSRHSRTTQLTEEIHVWVQNLIKGFLLGQISKVLINLHFRNFSASGDLKVSSAWSDSLNSTFAFVSMRRQSFPIIFNISDPSWDFCLVKRSSRYRAPPPRVS